MRKILEDLHLFYKAARYHRESYWGDKNITLTPIVKMVFYGIVLAAAIALQLPGFIVSRAQDAYMCYVTNDKFSIGEIVALETNSIFETNLFGFIEAPFIKVSHRTITYSLRTAAGAINGYLQLPEVSGAIQPIWERVVRYFNHDFLGQKSVGDFLLFTYNTNQPNSHCLYISKLFSLLPLVLLTAAFAFIVIQTARYAYQSRRMLWLMFRT